MCLFLSSFRSLHQTFILSLLYVLVLISHAVTLSRSPFLIFRSLSSYLPFFGTNIHSFITKIPLAFPSFTANYTNYLYIFLQSDQHSFIFSSSAASNTVFSSFPLQSPSHFYLPSLWIHQILLYITFTNHIIPALNIFALYLYSFSIPSTFTSIYQFSFISSSTPNNFISSSNRIITALTSSPCIYILFPLHSAQFLNVPLSLITPNITNSFSTHISPVLEF